MSAFWFRYEDRRVCSISVSEFDVITTSNRRVSLLCLQFEVVSVTPCGVWLRTGELNARRPGERWVRRDAHKRWACPTKEEALRSYRARKRRQIKILRAQLREAKAALQLTQDGQSLPVEPLFLQEYN